MYAFKDTEVGVVVMLCATAVLGIFEGVPFESCMDDTTCCFARCTLCVETEYSFVYCPLLLSGWDVIV